MKLYVVIARNGDSTKAPSANVSRMPRPQPEPPTALAERARSTAELLEPRVGVGAGRGDRASPRHDWSR